MPDEVTVTVTPESPTAAPPQTTTVVQDQDTAILVGQLTERVRQQAAEIQELTSRTAALTVILSAETERINSLQTETANLSATLASLEETPEENGGSVSVVVPPEPVQAQPKRTRGMIGRVLLG